MKKSKCMLLGAMSIFGTVGIFKTYIPMGAGMVAFARGVLGVLFLLLAMLVLRQKFDKSAIRENLKLLCLSGVAIGFNWVLLFESFDHTSVATATVCYYMAPLFLILASPLVGERLSAKKLLCVGVALVGLVFVSGMMDGGSLSLSDLKGVGLALGAAALYATVMVLNKRLTPIPAYDKTVIQLTAASLVIVPYIFLTGSTDISAMTGLTWVLLLIVGFVHTGFAYTIYFGSMKDLEAHTIGIFSYLDPVIAVLLSALWLREPLSLWGIAGTVLILGSALYSELPDRKK